MRRTLKILAAAAAVALPSAAHAQACTAAQLAANPFVALGYRALARINNTAFDLSCYYAAVGVNQVGIVGAPTVSFGVGPVTGTINQALFTTTPGTQVQFDYNFASNIPSTGPTAADFVYAFAAPLTQNLYTDATSVVTTYRTAGGPSIRIIPATSTATPALAGQPAYLKASNTNYFTTYGGTAANPFATALVATGNGPCTAGASCTFGPGQTSPNATIGAWGNLVSYRQDKRTTSGGISGTATLATVPEPATMTLMVAGLLALGGIGYARRREA